MFVLFRHPLLFALALLFMIGGAGFIVTAITQGNIKTGKLRKIKSIIDKD